MKIGKFETNNIYNVDSYQAIKDIPDKSIDLIYVDIPYLITHGGAGCSPLSLRIQKISNVDLRDIRDGIDYSIFDEFCRIMKYIYIYIWCSKDQILDICNYFVKEKGCTMNILCWCKTNPIPSTNNVWLSDVEYCLVFKGKGAPRYNDGYELKSKWYVSGINQKDKKDYEHPTIKPLELVKRHILHSTQENDIVLDCFLGSGTTAVACKELNRQYLGFEINKEYYDIACDRLKGITVQERKDKNAGVLNIFDFMEV